MLSIGNSMTSSTKEKWFLFFTSLSHTPLFPVLYHSINLRIRKGKTFYAYIPIAMLFWNYFLQIASQIRLLILCSSCVIATQDTKPWFLCISLFSHVFYQLVILFGKDNFTEIIMVFISLLHFRIHILFSIHNYFLQAVQYVGDYKAE